MNQMDDDVIYNLTHQFLNEFTDLLESESNTAQNSSYNDCIVQIIEKAKDGTGASSLQSAKYSAMFAHLESLDHKIEETVLIGNDGGTKMSKGVIDQKEVVTYGDTTNFPWTRNIFGVRLMNQN